MQTWNINSFFIARVWLYPVDYFNPTPPHTHTHTTPLPMIFGLLILKMRGLIKPNNDNEFLHVNVKEHLLKIYYINLLNWTNYIKMYGT